MSQVRLQAGPRGALRSALGRVVWPEHNTWGVDTGCVWGGQLTALRLDTPEPQAFQVDCDCPS